MSEAPPADPAPVSQTPTVDPATPHLETVPTSSLAVPGPVGGPVLAPVAAPVVKPVETPVGVGAYIFLTLVSIVVLVADLGTKYWAVRQLERDGFRLPAKEIVKGRLSFVLARNPGGAWGMLHDQPEKIRKPFFVIVSVVAVVVIVGMFRKLDKKQHALRWGLPLVLGGALGNLVDRIRYGQVIDFIDVVYWKGKTGLDHHWPTFNVADIAICIGVVLMAVDFLFPHRRAPRRVAPAKPTTPAVPPAA